MGGDRRGAGVVARLVQLATEPDDGGLDLGSDLVGPGARAT